MEKYYLKTKLSPCVASKIGFEFGEDENGEYVIVPSRERDWVEHINRAIDFAEMNNFRPKTDDYVSQVIEIEEYLVGSLGIKDLYSTRVEREYHVLKFEKGGFEIFISIKIDEYTDEFYWDREENVKKALAEGIVENIKPS